MNESKKKLKLSAILDQIYRDNCCDLVGMPREFTFDTVSRLILNDIYFFINAKKQVKILFIDNAMRVTINDFSMEICFKNIQNFTILLGEENDV